MYFVIAYAVLFLFASWWRDISLLALTKEPPVPALLISGFFGTVTGMLWYGLLGAIGWVSFSLFTLAKISLASAVFAFVLSFILMVVRYSVTRRRLLD